MPTETKTPRFDYVVAGRGWTVPEGELTAGVCTVVERVPNAAMNCDVVRIRDEGTGVERDVGEHEIRLTARLD